MENKKIKELFNSINDGAKRQNDFRDIKVELTKIVQSSLSLFSPHRLSQIPQGQIQVLDFFSGAGGTSLGFSAVNFISPVFKMLGGCDINRVSAQSYAKNFNTPLLNYDIVELVNDEPLLKSVLDAIGYDPNMPCVLIGCAPCQGFSSHRKKDWDKKDDIRNSLIIAFAKVVKILSPDVIVMENVPEFLSKKYWHYYSAAKSMFNESGYIIKPSIYNAASFGVPQERFRSIVVGMRRDFVLMSDIIERSDYKTVRDAIGYLPPIKAGEICPNDPLHKSTAHKQSTIDVIKQVPHNGGNRPFGVGPVCLDKTKGFSDTYGRLFWDKPSITITHYARNPASGRFSHPEQDRGLTAREAALLQSFPLGFEFDGKSDDIYRQIGEAVPPLLSSAIAVNILVEWLSLPPTKEEIEQSYAPINEPISSSYSSVIAGIKIKNKTK